jgi:hypothetical protein
LQNEEFGFVSFLINPEKFSNMGLITKHHSEGGLKNVQGIVDQDQL